MKKLSMIVTALLAFAAAPAFAQYPAYDQVQECWNPRAGHFEQVRPGEVQNDLDLQRCRPMRDSYYRGSERRYDGYADRDVPRECWNPRARHYEAVRPGERQDDLDFSRCQLARGYDRGYEPRYEGNQGALECWNPRAGHFENVREGTVQDDLDYGRCRRR